MDSLRKVCHFVQKYSINHNIDHVYLHKWWIFSLLGPENLVKIITLSKMHLNDNSTKPENPFLFVWLFEDFFDKIEQNMFLSQKVWKAQKCLYTPWGLSWNTHPRGRGDGVGGKPYKYVIKIIYKTNQIILVLQI